MKQNQGNMECQKQKNKKRKNKNIEGKGEWATVSKDPESQEKMKMENHTDFSLIIIPDSSQYQSRQKMKTYPQEVMDGQKWKML